MKRWRGAALLPALAGVLVPKCPLCVAAYLTAVGLGASMAATLGTVVVRVGPWLSLLVATALVARLLLRRLRGPAST